MSEMQIVHAAAMCTVQRRDLKNRTSNPVGKAFISRAQDVAKQPAKNATRHLRRRLQINLGAGKAEAVCAGQQPGYGLFRTHRRFGKCMCPRRQSFVPDGTGVRQAGTIREKDDA